MKISKMYFSKKMCYSKTPQINPKIIKKCYSPQNSAKSTKNKQKKSTKIQTTFITYQPIFQRILKQMEQL